MSIELWQLREVKRALITYCNDNQLDLGDEIALEAANRLLRFAREPSVNSDRLLRRLRDDVADPIGGAPSEQAHEGSLTSAQAPSKQRD